MFSKTAQYYDMVYGHKETRAEAERLVAITGENLGPEGNRLLDVACGTGCHLEYLKQRFSAEGLDIAQELLDIARRRNPDVAFHKGDMIDLDLGRKFDVIACLFSSIGYVETLENLGRAIG